MKKLKQIALVASLTITQFSSIYAQSTNCGGRQYGGGGWNPPINQVKAPSASLGGYTLPNTNVPNKANSKVIGDFNGDGLDDLLILVTECANAACSAGDPYVKLFLSDGNGNFTLSWTSSANNLGLTNGKSITLESSLKFIAGNFIGDAKDEVMVYKSISDGSQGTFYYMLSNLQNPTPTYSFGKEYPSPQTVDPKIGTSSLNGAKYYAANLIGDSHDELFSVEPTSNSNPSKWYMQTFDGTPSGIATLFTGANSFIGSWGIGSSDEYYFANFNVTTSYDELFCIIKSAGWAMVQNFNIASSSFQYNWSDMGNGDFFNTNQCSGYSIPFNVNSQLFFGNLDNCDDDIECLIIPNNDYGHPITLEYTSAEARFNCYSTLWPTMLGINSVAITQSALSATANELYRTPRVCTNYLWSNPNLCLQWSGGNQVIAPRQFYSRNEVDGSLQMIIGNFYNNTSNNLFIRNTSDFMIFRNNYAYDVPSNLNGTTFLTDCAPNGLYGGGCNSNTSIPLYNTLGQVIAYYNKPNDSFVGYGHKAGCNYSMYSLTNGNQNLRLASFNSNESTFELNNSNVDIKILPNPASDLISVDFYSTENLNETSVSIISSEGKITNILNVDVKSGKNTFDIDISRLTSGWYMLRFINESRVDVKKFIKQ